MKKGIDMKALFVLLVFITLYVLIFYEYFTTPEARLMPLIFHVVLVLWAIFTRYGEYLGYVILNPNFFTEGGLVGVFVRQENHSNGMATVYFKCQSRYLKYVGYTDYQERGLAEKVLSFLTPNVRTGSITAKSYLFEKVNDSNCDVPEGAIIYRGTLRKGTSVLHPKDTWKLERLNFLKTLTELNTIAEKAKSLSELSTLSQNKDIVSTSIQIGTAADNMVRSLAQFNNNRNIQDTQRGRNI